MDKVSKEELPYTDLQIRISDRQTLHLLEDMIADLKLILPSALRTIIRIQDYSSNWCEDHSATKTGFCQCDQPFHVLKDCEHKLEACIQRASELQSKAQKLSKLVSSLDPANFHQ
jgi:hypothetical protein